MSLKKRSYSVLMVSATKSLVSALQSLLPESTYDPVQIVSSIRAARQAVADRSFDLVIVNSPLNDDPGLPFVTDLCSLKGTVVLLLVKNALYAEIYDRVTDHGVFILSKPTSKPALSQALDWMVSARERLRRLEEKTLSIEARMEELRLVNQAKWLLIREWKMTEPDAHRYIEKQAMDRCISKKAMAEDIIRTYS